MKPFEPEFRVLAHFPGGIPHRRFQVIADERAGEISRCSGRVDDCRTCCDESLQIIHQRHALAEGIFDLFAVRNVRPRADDLKWLAGIIVNDFERVLDPNVVPVSMPEAVLNRSATALHQRTHLLEYTIDIVRVQSLWPKLGILEHLHSEKPMIGSTFRLTKLHL